MTGKRYYITTRDAWQRHAARFAHSHWMALGDAAPASPASAAPGTAAQEGAAQTEAAARGTRILVLIEADEGAHLALEDDPAFEPLPHPLAARTISEAAQSALAALGVAPGATTFDVAEAAARVHPLLRHRVF